MDLVDDEALREFPEHILRNLATTWHPSNMDPRAGSRVHRPDVASWVHTLLSSLPDVTGIILDGLRTTADWKEFRGQEVSELNHKFLTDLANGIASGSSSWPSDVTSQQFVNHRSLLVAINRSFEARGIKAMSEWEHDTLLGKSYKSTVRAAAATGVLWERTKEQTDFDIPAFRRMLSKITDVGDKARLVLIFVLARWDSEYADQTSRGDAWKWFVNHEAKRVCSMYGSEHDCVSGSASAPELYGSEMTHISEYSLYYQRSKCIESRMIYGYSAAETQAGDHPRSPGWNDHGQVLSGKQLENLKSQAYLNTDLFIRDAVNGYVKDDYTAQRYQRELDKKWAAFERVSKKESVAETLTREHYENHIDFEEHWRRSSSKELADEAKQTMRQILLAERPAEDVIYQAMKLLYTTKQDGDMWTPMSQEKKVAEFVKFKMFELYFEAYYSWCTRGVLPKQSVLADPWLQKLLRSLNIQLPTVFNLLNCLNGRVDEKYGYRSRYGANFEAGNDGGDSTRTPNVSQTGSSRLSIACAQNLSRIVD